MMYIHPYDNRINGFIENNISDRSDIKTVSNNGARNIRKTVFQVSFKQ